jgi:protein-arginine kinase activator protein McsA
MTKTEKEKIEQMRLRGVSYSEIAKRLNLNISTVKTYCRRNNLQTATLQPLEEQQDFIFCKQCGKPLLQSAKQKPKKFCSDKCRMAWWNSHRDEVNKKGASRLVCSACGNTFESYDTSRKYCCHACYITDRFGGKRHDT